VAEGLCQSLVFTVALCSLNLVYNLVFSEVISWNCRFRWQRLSELCLICVWVKSRGGLTCSNLLTNNRFFELVSSYSSAPEMGTKFALTHEFRPAERNH
jgi:hypothetical protein